MSPDEKLPTVEDVFAIHDDLVDQYGLPPGTGRPLPHRPIESAIEDAAEESNHYRRAAILLRRIGTAHVFEDGNKRTAFTTAGYYLRHVGCDVAPSQAQAAVVMQHFKRFDVDELAEWLRTAEIDTTELRRSYPE